MILLLLSLACTEDKSGPLPGTGTGSGTTEPLDMRVLDVPAPPEGGVQVLGAEVVIEPYTDAEYCIFASYEGEDAGIVSYDAYQTQYGHHAIMLASTSDPYDYPDGTIVDCRDNSAATMVDVEPIVIAPTFGAGENLYDLPEGMAAPLESRTRFMIQSHYVNTSADPILVRDVVNLGLVPEDQVVTWTSPFAFTTIEMKIPEGEYTVELDCTVEEDLTVSYLMGHLHEWGTAISFDRIDAQGASERMYEIDPWLTEYRDAPPIDDYSDGRFVMTPGETYRTTCTWNNDTGAPLEFPNEMCAISGMIYPARNSLICTD